VNLPDTYEMPDLSDLFAKQVLDTMLNMMFGNYPAAARAAQPQFVNLVRLTDKALSEYEAARAALDDFAVHRGSGRLSPLFRGVDHLESCINATHRAFQFARALRESKAAPPIPRQLVIRDPEFYRVRGMRDAVEHLYEDLRAGTVVPGEAQFLQPQRDGIEIGKAGISWVELAVMLRRLHTLVLYLNAQ
jgi:hypothetical protein